MSKKGHLTPTPTEQIFQWNQTKALSPGLNTMPSYKTLVSFRFSHRNRKVALETRSSDILTKEMR